MYVFVLLESGQTSPVGVFTDPSSVHDFLPADAHLVASSDVSNCGHRKLVSEWRSEKLDLTHRLVAYKTY